MVRPSDTCQTFKSNQIHTCVIAKVITFKSNHIHLGDRLSFFIALPRHLVVIEMLLMTYG